MSAPPSLLDPPKVELHVHLDCAASYGAVRTLAPYEVSLADYRRDFVAPARCTDLADFLTRPPRIVALMQDERGLRTVVDDLFEQFVRDGVVYAEPRFAPLLHEDGVLSARDAVAIVERATAAASEATGVEARLILCTLRHFDAEQSLRTAQLAVDFRGSLVVGLDIAGDEAGFPLEPHAAAFRLAAEHGVHLTAHAGEAAGAASVRETLDRLAPARIGHGVRSVEDPELVRELRDRRIHLEVCPSSNVQTGVAADYREHPIDRLRAAGVPLSVSTDARTVTAVSLRQEYDRLRSAFGWTDADFRDCNRHALEASFADEATRARLLALVDPVAAPAPAPADRSGAGPEQPGSFIQTISGRWLDPFDPDPAQIDPHDIAQALSNQCRFGGHSRAFYSVAQHASIVSDLALAEGASAAEALGALLHDAAEAYLVDLPHPLKHRSELGTVYRRAEASLERAIARRFELPPALPHLKRIDRSLLAVERHTFTEVSWHWPELDGAEPLELTLEPWDPPTAAREFLDRFERLDAARR